MAENPSFCPPREKYNRETGIHRYALSDGTEITGVSANTWSEFEKLLELTSPTDKIVVSPELITYTHGSFDELAIHAEEITARIEHIIDFSGNRPTTVFVVGTPLFVNPEKPRNSALLIKNGEIIGATNKRSGATADEVNCFELMPEEPPLLIPGTNTALLICADLPIAMLFSGNVQNGTDEMKRILELANKSYLFGKTITPLAEDATSALVMSCWGVGGNFVQEGNADEYYRFQLRNICWRLMRDTKINEVVMIDRTPIEVSSIISGLTPDKPYNGILIKNPSNARVWLAKEPCYGV